MKRRTEIGTQRQRAQTRARTYTRTKVHAHARTRARRYKRTHVHTNARTRVSTCTIVYAHAPTRARTGMNVNEHTRTCERTKIRIRVQAYTQVHSSKHKNTNMHIPRYNNKYINNILHITHLSSTSNIPTFNFGLLRKQVKNTVTIVLVCRGISSAIKIKVPISLKRSDITSRK